MLQEKYYVTISHLDIAYGLIKSDSRNVTNSWWYEEEYYSLTQHSKHKLLPKTEYLVPTICEWIFLRDE